MSRKRLNYAQVCVEIDAGASLIKEFDLASENTEDPCQDPIKIRVEYQWKPAKCSHCLVFGHSSNNYGANPVAMTGPSSDPKGNEPEPDATTSKLTTGWYRVRRKSRHPEKPENSSGGSTSNRAIIWPTGICTPRGPPNFHPGIKYFPTP